jgi:hypothetical protein
VGGRRRGWAGRMGWRATPQVGRGLEPRFNRAIYPLDVVMANMTWFQAQLFS